MKNIEGKAIIFEHVSNLKGKTNPRKRLFFIRDDVTDQEAEQRRLYQDLLKENKLKEESKRLNIKMSKGRVVVNNKVLHQQVKAPKDGDLLCFNEEELTMIKAMKTVAGGEHSEKGSNFYSYATKVSTSQRCQQSVSKNENQIPRGHSCCVCIQIKGP